MAIESTLTETQKENLEEARKMMGLRSRAEVFRAFANHAVELVKEYRILMAPRN